MDPRAGTSAWRVTRIERYQQFLLGSTTEYRIPRNVTVSGNCPSIFPVVPLFVFYSITATRTEIGSTECGTRRAPHRVPFIRSLPNARTLLDGHAVTNEN